MRMRVRVSERESVRNDQGDFEEKRNNILER